jgi:nucleoside-diphosphate-sugar epimerase
VAELLARGRAVRAFDRVPTPGVADSVIGDVTDPAACRRAVVGVGTLIHLAATPDDVEDPVRDLFPPNIVGVYQVMQAARTAGVQRYVLASSGQVVWYQRQTGPLPIGTQVQPTPRSWYAATKLFLEGVGRSFAEFYGATVLAVRLGWCPRPGQEKEIAANAWAQDVYLSPRDAGRFFACAVEAPLKPGFALVYAMSNPLRQAPYDLEPARQLVGYTPQERWPDGIDPAKLV